MPSLKHYLLTLLHQDLVPPGASSVQQGRHFVPVALTMLVIAACSSSGAPTPSDAAAPLDGAADAASSDAAPAGCNISTCKGTVFVPAGSSVSQGDSCKTICTCGCSGGGVGICMGSCPWVDGCTCPDGG